MQTAEGYFANGDQWHGDRITDDWQTFYIATDSEGNEYETSEMPTRYPLFTMARVDNGISGDEAMRQIAAIKAAQ